MAVSSYEEDGKILWKIYINIRSKEDPGFREQKRIFGIDSEKSALAEEKKLTRILTEQLMIRISKGKSWDHVVGRWEMEMRNNKDFYSYEPDTISDHVSLARRWTEGWLTKTASSIFKGDARELFMHMQKEGKSYRHCQKVKNVINIIFKWGIEQKLILGVNTTPVEGLSINVRKEEQVPDILTLEEMRKLLFYARTLQSPWYPVWATAMLTGMRNGELHALLWSDIDFANRKLTCGKSYHSKRRVIKCTKSGQWRTVPISDELMKLLLELKATSGDRPQVLPRFFQWDNGTQAKVLRAFCVGVGLPPIKFHALRACFATQLLSHDIAPARVMKICGWKDLKTMQYYIRLAGVDEKGATQILKLLPDDHAVMGEVVNLLEFKKIGTQHE